MKKLFLGILIGICLPLIGGYLFVICGGMPVATKGDPLPFERYLAKKAKRAAYKVDLDKTAPFELTAERLSDAIRIYKNNCGGCHGIGNHENKMAKAMFPPVPQFFQHDHSHGDGKKHEGHLQNDPIGEIYWKVKNGIRLTGMPAYVDILTEEQIWEVSLFLKSGEKVPAERK